MGWAPWQGVHKPRLQEVGGLAGREGVATRRSARSSQLEPAAGTTWGLRKAKLGRVLGRIAPGKPTGSIVATLECHQPHREHSGALRLSEQRPRLGFGTPDGVQVVCVMRQHEVLQRRAPRDAREGTFLERICVAHVVVSDLRSECFKVVFRAAKLGFRPRRGRGT